MALALLSVQSRAADQRYMTMTREQIDLARHALGLDGRRKQSYRNHFVAGPGHADWHLWMALVAAGDAKVNTKRGPLTGGDDCFWLTVQGARKAIFGNERLDPEDFPASVTPHIRETE